LLEPPPRTPSGYRQYTQEALWRLNFIARAKELGFTLREVEQLLAGSTPSTVLEATRAKLQAVVEQQDQLATVRDRLEVLARLCESGDEDCATLTIPSKSRAPREDDAGRECQ
jgi:DNA-binding transcriptional MerR regulator